MFQVPGSLGAMIAPPSFAEYEGAAVAGVTPEEEGLEDVPLDFSVLQK